MHYSRDINLYGPLDLDSICVLPLSTYATLRYTAHTVDAIYPLYPL